MISYDDSKSVINRILDAYKLKTVKSLADKWNITASVIGSRIQRNTFPSDFVIRCSLETGANLLWLCTGQGEPGVDGIHSMKKEVLLFEDIIKNLDRLVELRDKEAITEKEYYLLKDSLFNR